MKHAGCETLGQLKQILNEIRKLKGLTEKKRGTFYRGSVAFLHFHEDPTGFFAGLKIGPEFHRWPVNNRDEIATFLHEARRATH